MIRCCSCFGFVQARSLALACITLVMAAGCATLPHPTDRVDSKAITGSAETPLGAVALHSEPSKDVSGFRLLPTGAYAYNTRISLIQRAVRSIDAQYYLIANDESGRFFLKALRDAARRGVRVRLLVDDLYTASEDKLLLAMSLEPNVEVRLFNPFPGGRDNIATRFGASLFDLGRVNHRMHNKLMIADGVMAVAGGRNIGNEYFMRSMQSNFVDLDSFMMGPIVGQLADIFDDYWNSRYVYPVADLVHSMEGEQKLIGLLDDETSEAKAPPPEPLPRNDVLGYGPLSDDLQRGQLGLIWAPAVAYADLPSKISMSSDNITNSVQYDVMQLMRAAKSEIVISSPYMIPGKAGMEMLEEVRARGVKVRVLTNSLAATDEPIVHIGYSHYREKMLKLGVEIYELSPNRLRKSARFGMLFGNSIGRLHAKMAVIDRHTVFIGSMNFDPRSAHENTELGVIIQSDPLAKEVLRLLDLDRFQSAYRLSLQADGRIQWLATNGEGVEVLTDEPDSSLAKRLELDLLAPFAPEELL